MDFKEYFLKEEQYKVGDKVTFVTRVGNKDSGEIVPKLPTSDPDENVFDIKNNRGRIITNLPAKNIKGKIE